MKTEILKACEEKKICIFTLLWQLKDLGITGVCAVASVLALTQAGIFFPAVLTAVYAFLTIRFEDASILDFIRYACEFFFIRQQSFEWRRCSE